ncbi:MAG: tetratricopeptide repeat protein [Chloroflexota bacterium]
MFAKTTAIVVLLLLLVPASAARADANDDYNRCAALSDHQASFACIEKLAESGNATAQLALGGFYAGGYGVPQDPQQAAVWYQKSAEQGNAVAMSRIGDAYLTGTGVTQDYGKAASWFARAASAGDPWSLEMLGSLYEEGEGVEQDDIKAYQWYDIAAVNGDSHAAELRDALAQKMTAEQIAEAKNRSSEWLAQSAKQATAEGRAAVSKVVADCVTVVRGTNTSPFYTNFNAVYRPATGLIEYNGVQEQGPIVTFKQCMAAKGYSIAGVRAQ